MIFQRSLLSYLNEWADRPNRKPLILRGARQVGKTTLVNNFGAQFDSYIYLNLDLEEDRLFFEKDYSLDDLLTAIFLVKKVDTSIGGRTLIFIDEIQNSPGAINMLRYFFEKRPDIFVISAGSLLENTIDFGSSFPVGRVEYAFVYPVSFVEFLRATGESLIAEAMDGIATNPAVHDRLLYLFHRYVMIGGMPEVVSNYAQYGDVASLTNIYEALNTSYVDDIEKYTSGDNQRRLLRHVIANIPQAAGQRIKFQGFGNSDYRSRDIAEVFEILQKAMLISLCYPTTSTDLPIGTDRKKSPKLFFVDTGMINYFGGLQSSLVGIDDLNTIYRGLVTEHVVAQELRSRNFATNRETTFWVRESGQSNAEVDFVVQYADLVIPVEVKSGKAGSLRSLHQFIDRTNHNFAVRLCHFPVSIESTQTLSGKQFYLLNLPYYLAAKIDTYLKWFVETSNAKTKPPLA